MNVAAFYSELRTAIGRGSSTDASFPGWATDASEEIEGARTYEWMKRRTNFAVLPGPASNKIVLPGKVKAVAWVKPGETTNAGKFNETITYGRELHGVSPNQITSFDYGRPVAFYWDDEANNIVMDARPDANTVFFVEYYAYTVWPTDTAQTPAILDKKHQLLKASFMMKAAADLRDTILAQLWSGSYDRLTQVAVSADTELQWRHRNGMSQAS